MASACTSATLTWRARTWASTARPFTTCSVERLQKAYFSRITYLAFHYVPKSTLSACRWQVYRNKSLTFGKTATRIIVLAPSDKPTTFEAWSIYVWVLFHFPHVAFFAWCMVWTVRGLNA
jgi:hypothetical protein